MEILRTGVRVESGPTPLRFGEALAQQPGANEDFADSYAIVTIGPFSNSDQLDAYRRTVIEIWLNQ